MEYPIFLGILFMYIYMHFPANGSAFFVVCVLPSCAQNYNNIIYFPCMVSREGMVEGLLSGVTSQPT